MVIRDHLNLGTRPETTEPVSVMSLAAVRLQEES
jgi:hypothetical protein